MSRLTNYTKSLLSGYGSVGANMLFTFASVPLALHYLSKPEFALFALTQQIVGYLSLLDIGMGGSISRVLIDHKDDREGTEYGGLIKTGAAVGIVQGLIVLICGVAMAFPFGALLEVPAELRRELRSLLIAQAVILAVSFSLRIFQHILIAHQRYDIPNHIQSVSFVAGLGAMWIGFEAGWGVYSLIASQVVYIALALFVPWMACVKLGLLPRTGGWGEMTWARFTGLFSYGKDVFLYLLGLQFTTASQTILLTRFMGLEAAAVWSVCSRMFNLLTILVTRFQEYSGPALAEMYVRGQRDRMLQRLRDLVVVSTNISVAGGLVLAACNNDFVQIWTTGRIEWAPVNDVLLGLWFMLMTAMRAHVPLSGAIKRFGFLSYIFLVEGLLFLGLNIAARNVDGMTRMLVISVFCTSALTLPYIHWRTMRFFSLSLRDVLGWYSAVLAVAWRMVLVVVPCYVLTTLLPPIPSLVLNGTVIGVAAAMFVTRFGLPSSLRADIAGKLPPPLQRAVALLAGDRMGKIVAVQDGG